MPEPVPTPLRRALIEAMGGWGPFTVREIEGLFSDHGFEEAADVEPEQGVRRTAAAEYLAPIDWSNPDQQARLIGLAEEVLEFHPEGEGESAVSPGRRTVAYPLLVASLVSTMAGDLLFSVLALSQQYTGVSAADAAYLLGYLLLGAAALHPSMARLSQPAPERRARLPRGRLLAMGAAALVAPALLLVQRLRGAEIEVAPIAGGWALLFVLVMIRMAGLVRVIEQAEAERSRLLDRTIQVAEEERVQVAAELHDGPIQRLTAVTYDLERAKQRLLGADPAVGAARLDQAQSALSFEVQRLRQLMVALRPPALDEVGLEAALRDQVSAFGRRLGVDCTLRVALDGRLGGELETVVYRVTQEALLNVARHAHAGRIWLELEGVGDRVDLRISDDGVGFEPVPSSVLVRDGHFGLVGMRERVELAGGSWQVDARPGSGVTIRASFHGASTAA